MIDFRYHLVSIVAVFLALAIGIVVGAQAISLKLANGLNSASQHAVKYNRALNAQNNELKNQINADNAFAQAVSATALHGLLLGEQVVLVVAPGADSQTVTGVAAALRQAGATVTGQVVLTAQFFDTGAVTEQALKNTAVNLAPAGITLPRSTTDPQIPGQQAAVQVIAAAVVDSGLATLTATQSQQILTGFGEQGFLQISGPGGGTTLAGQATMAVVVIPSTVPPARSSGPFNLALVSLAQDLQEASKGALLAGSYQGSGTGSAIDAVASGGAGVALTTVDNADSATGQIFVAQALRELLTKHGTSVSYGVRSGTVPSPAPSPVPAPSASPSRSTRKKATT